MADRKKRRGRVAPTMARSADRHRLYEASVQDTDAEVEFLDRTYRRLRKRSATTLREGFCGTAKLCLTWVESRQDRRAWGVDLHGPTLRWGEKNHLAGADRDARDRVELVQANVLDHASPAVDIAVGFNFSYWCFQTREALRAYFESACAGLAEDGVLFLDCYGGTEVPKADVEERIVELDGSEFTYRWVHDSFNPLTHNLRAHIEFELADGSTIPRAFRYDWRMWSLPEIRELLLEAGFRSVHVYWEDEDEDGDGNGRYRERRSADNEGIWWVYIAAVR
jgi:hypothetical protein